MISIFKSKIYLTTTKPIEVVRKEILDNKKEIAFTEVNLNNDNLYIYSELNNNKRSHFFSSYKGVIKQTNRGTEVTGYIYFLKVFEIGFWILVLLSILFTIKFGQKALLISPLIVVFTFSTFLVFLSFEKKRYSKIIQKLISA